MGDGPLIDVNPALDQEAAAKLFAERGRVQLREVLRPASAESVRSVLKNHTPWSLAWQAGDDGPHLIRAEEIARLSQEQRAAIQRKLVAALEGRDYAFLYSSYPLLQAYLDRWSPGSPQERLLEEINSPPFLDLLREVTGDSSIIKADGHISLFAPGHFLSHHNDSHVGKGRRGAYVLNMTVGHWRPEWGGYLNFFDDDWDVEEAFMPRFNSLNLFRVPQFHSVGQVATFAPPGRLAIAGWAYDR